MTFAFTTVEFTLLSTVVMAIAVPVETLVVGVGVGVPVAFALCACPVDSDELGEGADVLFPVFAEVEASFVTAAVFSMVVELVAVGSVVTAESVATGRSGVGPAVGVSVGVGVGVSVGVGVIVSVGVGAAVGVSVGVISWAKIGYRSEFVPKSTKARTTEVALAKKVWSNVFLIRIPSRRSPGEKACASPPEPCREISDSELSC